ncbi:MAG: oligosaccharide flippase family protein [Candidatus Levybacteria bacterium]|nr:oligosaccharide flippase family protein [Candidatus Levybacteria bacterium]
MRKKINKAIKHPLISGSIFIFFGSSAANVLNFFFNFFMVRNLSIVDYGILASLISLITISITPAVAFVPTIVRFGAFYLAKDNLEMIRGFYIKLTKASAGLGLFILFVFLLFSKDIGRFFRINDPLLVFLAGTTVVLGLIGVVNSGLLQAKLSFKFISLTNFVGALLKFAIGLLLVYFGFAVKGALFAFFISFFIPYFISFIPLRFIFQIKTKIPKINNLELFSYGVPSAISLFGLTSLITADILMVKHFFDPKSAGIYASISLIGRVIFFLTAPITTVMFPLIVQKHTKNENYHTTFKLSILLVLLPSVFLTIIYFLFPELVIKLFFNKREYLDEKNMLGLFAIFITAYSLLAVFVNFFLSIKKTKVFIPIIIGAISQIVLISFYHKTFLQVIIISSLIAILLLILLLIYYLMSFYKHNDKI